jgi:hypothetical protein
LKYLLSLFLYVSGCANAPTYYGQRVIIISGTYKGIKGILKSDCSWFENYKVILDNKVTECFRPWEMERIN